MAENLRTHSSSRFGMAITWCTESAPRRKGRTSADDLDWLSLGRTLWRRKLFLLGFVVIVLGLTAAYVSRLPPAYEAEALVMLNERRPSRCRSIEEVLAGLPPDENGLQGQLLLIKSRSMAERHGRPAQPAHAAGVQPGAAAQDASFAGMARPGRADPAVGPRVVCRGPGPTR